MKSFLHQKKIEELLEGNEKNAEENHAMEMRSMIGNVAHDLKTPLASFISGLDIIEDILFSAQKKTLASKGATPESLPELFSSIRPCLLNIRNTNAFMLMTINRCLDYTKASKGMKLVPKYETVTLREVLQFPIECMSNIQERIQIKLQPLAREICTHIITDKQWLQENLLCLLSNAVKYSAEGLVTITVSLYRQEKELSAPVLEIDPIFLGKIVPIVENSEDCRVVEYTDMLLFEIEDHGIGLSEEAMKNLYNPFKQAQRLAGGTGLGLYSLAKRMEALKGSYGVKKRKDGQQGSLFHFAFPYKPDRTSAETTFRKQTQRIAAAANLQNISKTEALFTADSAKCQGLEILVVDDAPSILKMASMMLKRQGHQTWVAENGEVALKIIEEKWKCSGKGFDLVLMDLQMPVMDGLEATRRLRKMESEGRSWMVKKIESESEGKSPDSSVSPPHQTIFGVSANSDHETVEDARLAGVDDFLGKPFSLETFKESIGRLFISRE